MIKNSIAAGILLVVFSMAGLYAQSQKPQPEPYLTEKAVQGLIKSCLKASIPFWTARILKKGNGLNPFRLLWEKIPIRRLS